MFNGMFGRKPPDSRGPGTRHGTGSVPGEVPAALFEVPVHVVIDGAIDTDFIRERSPEKYAAGKETGGILNPNSIAENYWMLHKQPRDAWTQELDLRPWSEKW